MRIRPATLADCPAILAIYNHYVRTSTSTYQEEEDTLAEREAWFARHGLAHPVVVLMEVTGRILGWGSLSPFHARSAYRFTVENSLYVHPDFLGQGLGRRLLEELITRARQLGHQQMIALISSEQTASGRLHRALGFKRAGQLEGVGVKFDQRLSLDLWQLDLR